MATIRFQFWWATLTVERGVALQAELPALTTHQEHAVGVAVRIVADHATLNSYRRMLEDVRPALLHVALDAGLPVRLVQAGPVQTAVRTVAVGALHQSFGDAVMDRQGKLGFDRAVTGVAGFGLGPLEQAIVQPADLVRELRDLEEVRLRVSEAALALVLDFVHQVGGVTLVAGKAVRGVLGVGEGILLLARDVAG